jgi:hypothetical protein
VRTQRQEQELMDLLRTELRDIGGPVASIADRIDEAEDALTQPRARILSALQELLAFLESFRRRRLGRDLIRRAFATALAIRWLHVKGPQAHGGQNEAIRRADEWLEGAAFGARFWLDAVGRSNLLR